MKLYTQEVDSCLSYSCSCPHGYWPEVNYVRYTCGKTGKEVFKNAPDGTDNHNYIPEWCPLEDVKK